MKNDIEICKISVIIPTYNRSKTIEYCLSSVLNQTYLPFEILIVDDCSTDDTVDIVKKINSPLVKCIVLDQNSGAQAARNTGIKAAKGNWLAFLDSDDEWVPEKLELQIETLKKYNFNTTIVLHSNCCIFNTQSRQKNVWNLPVIEGKECYKKLLTQPSPMFQGLVASKEIFDKINYLDQAVPSHQEWDTSIKLAKFCQFVHIKKPLFIYHLHENETISKNKKRDINGYQYIIEKYKNQIIEIAGETAWQNHIKRQLEYSLEFELWKLAEKYLTEYKPYNRNDFYIFKAAFNGKIKPSCYFQKKRIQKIRFLIKQYGIFQVLKLFFIPNRYRICHYKIR